MDLAQHYETYRTSVRSNALENFSAYAKERGTRDPERYPTVHSYLSAAVAAIQQAIQSNDSTKYREWLQGHQSALKGLFAMMVSDHVRACCIAQPGIDGIQVALNMAHEKGWDWFKFAGYNLKFEDMIWCGRHAKLEKDFELPVFDADELKLLFQRKPEQEWVNWVKSGKRQNHMKIVARGEKLDVVPLVNLNMGQVDDWAWELFP